jgi:hypothetical protein
MTGMLYAFLLTKSSDLPLYYFPFFLHIYNYPIIDSGYREASSYYGGFDPGDA